jgi:hypothetical protein
MDWRILRLDNGARASACRSHLHADKLPRLRNLLVQLLIFLARHGRRKSAKKLKAINRSRVGAPFAL